MRRALMAISVKKSRFFEIRGRGTLVMGVSVFRSCGGRSLTNFGTCWSVDFVFITITTWDWNTMVTSWNKSSRKLENQFHAKSEWHGIIIDWKFFSSNQLFSKTKPLISRIFSQISVISTHSWIHYALISWNLQKMMRENLRNFHTVCTYLVEVSFCVWYCSASDLEHVFAFD